MKEIKPKYVTFEQAKWLKEKGFDIWVQKHYDGYEEPFKLRCSNGFKMPSLYPNSPKFDYMSLDMVYYVPEQWQIVEWLWETYLIDVSIIPIREKGCKTIEFQFRVINFSDPEVDEVMFEHQYNSSFQHFTSKQEAYSAAFDYILKELI